MKKINWRQAFAEVGLLLVGASVAFWVDSVADSRREVAEEQSYLSALHEDFTENVQLIEDNVRANAVIRDAGRALLGASDNLTGLPPDSLTTLLGSSFLGADLASVMATYQDMVNSGDIRLLRNPDLRVSLARFEGLLQSQDDMTRWAWDYWVLFEQPLLVEAEALSGLYPDYRGITMPPATASPDLTRLAEPDFRQLLTSRIWAQQDIVRGGEALLEEAQQVLDLIATSRR